MKRKTQKAFAGILIAGLTVGTAMTSATTASAATKKVKLSKSKVTVTEKKKATVTVKNAGKSTVKAKMANKKIATVKVSKKKLTITGKKAGKTKLTVTVKGMKKCTITVTVKKAAVQTKKPAVQTKKPVVTTTNTNTNSVTKGPDMQVLTRSADFVMNGDKSLGEKLTVTGKIIGNRLVVCVTNNNTVPVSVSVSGEEYHTFSYYDGIDHYSSQRDSLVSSNYIVPGGKFYGEKRVYGGFNTTFKMSLSNIKIGEITCNAADTSYRYRLDCVNTEFSRAANGTLKVKVTKNPQLIDSEVAVWVTCVFKDSAGNVTWAWSSYYYFDSSVTSELEYLYDAPRSYDSVEVYSYFKDAIDE